ncbi:MAG: hypothetical protein AB8H79_17065 [Myxococcota bacterium]
MRLLIPSLLALALVAGCGKKKPVEAAVAAVTPEVPAAPAPPPEPEPEPEPEPPKSNADFTATFTMADGTTKSGKVTRVERGLDWYAEDGWTDDADDLVVSLESGNDLVEKPWEEVDTVNIAYGNRDGIDCQYDSGFTPWMYMCVLRTTTKAKTVDGKSWALTTRNRWKFTFSDGSDVDFYVYKLPERQQDDKTMGLDSVENYDLYGTLQAKVMETAKGSAVVKIDIDK